MSKNDKVHVMSASQMATRRLCILTEGFRDGLRSDHFYAFWRFLRGEPVERTCETAIARFMRGQPSAV